MRTNYREAEVVALDSRAFGLRLSHLRREAGLSQVDLAGDDVSASYISLLESGKRQPSSRIIALLSSRLGCSPSMLHEGHASERDRRIALEIAYARLALTHGEPASSRDQLLRLLSEGALDRHSEDEATLLLGSALEKVGDFGAAVDVLLPLFERSCRRETHLPVSSVAVVLCVCYADSGDFNRVVAVGQSAFDAALAQGLAGTEDYYRLAASILWGYYETGDLAHARAWSQRLITEAETQGATEGQAALYWNAAIVADSLGKVEEALHLSGRALATMSESGTTRDLVRIRIVIGQFLLGTQPPRADEALQTLNVAKDDLGDLGSQIDRMRWERTVATACLLLGDLVQAHGLAEAAVKRGTSEQEELGASMIVLGDVEAARGADDTALEWYLKARDTLYAAIPARATARSLRDLGDRLRDVGRAEDAAACYEHALSTVGLSDRTAAARAVARQQTRQVLAARE